MSFVRNQWYVAAYAAEVGRALLARTILGEPIVLLPDQRRRGRSRWPTAACTGASRCPQSQLDGDTIVCGYHGFTYGTGRPVRRRARPAAHPADRPGHRLPGRRAGLVRLGVDRRPRPRRRRRSSRGRRGWPTSGYTTVRGMEPLAARYGLLVDNLLDLSHETYLHGGYIGTPEVADTPITTEVDEDARHHPGQPPHGRRRVPAVLRRVHRASTGRITRWQDIEYHPPCLYLLHSRIAPVGVLPRPDGTDPDAFHVEVVYAITPSTETSTLRLLGRGPRLRARRRGGVRLPARQQPDRGAAGRGRAEHAGAGASPPSRRATRSSASTSTPAGWPPGACWPGWRRGASSGSGAVRHGDRATAVYRVDWLPGTDRLRGTCHCGADQRARRTRSGMWEWLLAHPDDHLADPAAANRSAPGRRDAHRSSSLDLVVGAPCRRGRRRDRARPARPGRGGAAGLGARRAHRPDPGARPDPAVLAVRRPGRPAPAGGSPCSASRPAGAARRTCTTRSAEGSAVRVRGPRNHFPLRARRPLPVHRGRHRHHPDPAHAGRGGRRRRARGRWSTAGAPRASMAFRAELAGAVRRPGADPARRTRPGCSTWPPSSAGRSPARWSTAAGPAPLLDAVTSAAPAGRRARCTSSASPRRCDAPAVRRGLRGRAGPVRADPDGAAGPVHPADASRTPGSRCSPPVPRAPAGPARPACSTASRTTGTRCCPPSRAGGRATP